MLKKSNLLAGGAIAGVRLTDNERRLGRLIRDGEGHPAPAPAPAPEPSPAPAPAPGEQDDFSEFEESVSGSDDDDFGDDVDPAARGADDDDEGTPPEPEDRQGASVQERIDELTAAQRQAERDRDEERRANDLLRRELEQLKGKTPEGKDEKKERGPGERPNPDDFEFGEADSKFIEELAVWRADQRYDERERQRQLNEEVAQVETGWNTAISNEDVKAKYPDFDEKVTKGADRGDWDLSPLGAIIVKTSPVGPDVAHYLANNATESKRIAQLNPFEQAQEFGRLEGRFMNSGEQKAPAKIASEAPEPPAARSRGAGGQFQTAPDTDDFSAFDKYADGVLAKKK